MTFQTDWTRPNSNNSLRHTYDCSGYWSETDGDEIQPGYMFWYPETVHMVLGRRRRLLQDIPQDLWEHLSYEGEDSARGGWDG